jgi:cAMP-dependent protein kinase regulator
LKITRAKFQELGLNEKLQFANRKAVGGGGRQKVAEAKAPTPKNDVEKGLIASALTKNENLQSMVSLDQGRIDAMVACAWKDTVSNGTAIITEGDLQADHFYIVQEGSFEITVSETVDNSTQQVVKGMVSKGESFGELALLYLVPRAATVTAKQDSTVWVIGRQNFKNILMKVSEDKIKEYMGYLDRVELLNSLLREEKKAIAEALVEMHFAKGEVILQQNEPGNTFYILYEGEVEVIKDNKVVTKLEAKQKAGAAQYFGEKALLKNEPRAATVKVNSETAKALALDRESFDMLLGSLTDIIKRA